MTDAAPMPDDDWTDEDADAGGKEELTGIAWTEETWNPTTGCTHASAGCDHCYAERMAHRLRGRHGYPQDDPFRPELQPQRLETPLRWTKPRLVFVDRMSDLFHPAFDEKYIAKVFAIMDLASWHTYQVLTKRPERAAELLSSEDFRLHVGWAESQVLQTRPGPDSPAMGPWPLRNVWIGTSVESQQTANLRIPQLLRCPANVRFLSCEPLLAPVNLRDPIDGIPWLGEERRVDCGGCEATPVHGRPFCPGHPGGGIDWVIAGGESGPGARPCDPDWLRGIRDQCVAAGVPFFLKQLGGHPDKRAHQKAVLDGRTWTQMP